MPISALSLKFYNIIYFSSTLRRDIPTEAQLDQKFTSYLHALTRFRPAKDFDIRYVFKFASIFQMSN